MRIELRSRLRRLCFEGTCLIFVALYLTCGLRAYMAAHFAARPDLANIRKATALEPSNAEYHELLARNLALSGPSLEEAISAYRTAVHLNPYESRYWLDLAGAYQVAGRVEQQKQSVEQAVEADPATPHVAWEAANFFLLQGDQEKALRSFRVVLANDPDDVDSALQICWRASADANQVVDLALPKRPDLYLSFLRLLIFKQEVDAAETVWNRLIALNQEFSTKLALPYFRFLIVEREVAAAETAWRQLASVNRSLQPYLPIPGNLVVNGGFEENVLNGGFDWWYQSNPHAKLAIDTNDFSDGSRSLSVTFDGMNPGDAGIFQFIPVKPNTAYEFSAESRTEDIVSASGPRFAIVDAYTNAPYVLTDDLLGTNPWRVQHARFQTGPNTNLVALKIVRQPGVPLIRGKLWIDNLKLVEK
jgi:tetratricopeptide (TPR) repeat protein